MRPRVVFFHLLNNFTGSPQILSSVIHTALKEGYDVSLYTSETDGFLSSFERKTNFYKRSEHRIFTLFSFFFSQLLLAIQLLFTIQKEQKIFYVNTILPFGAILVGRLLGKRVITHVHENEINPKLLSNFLFWVVRNFSSEVIVVSDYLQANANLQGIEAQVIYNCVTKDFEEKSKMQGVKSERFDVLMLASLRPYKGVTEFISLAKRLPAVSFTLVLSDESEEVNQFVETEVLTFNIQVFPVQKDVHPFFEKASLILNLTHPDECVETFGMTILEGMYYNLPAIVPEVGGVTELVEEGFNGFCINYTKLDKIAGKIEKMVAEPDFWKLLSSGSALKKIDFVRGNFEEKVANLLNQ
ncbi:glycosyltransferase involved in cell wall biosynthesis [Algoriphagus ratkowskyi]|uniref:Glycosyltransferase family 4 protein n=1 Tax=Algoriphagus ratkowskyi TaxID=57028 RepID=A0A2W7RCG0_9BACT|nr:glycosyltransferase family 4 protein [Algoriphagus ratkowskyi]PZX57781.1 glycosyltransferase involved in cell wall biosynthesis [Algoriphagus ratkowskyi]TXD79045.1 glycosyltransferase family 4 protein [Algoriphagus ratkowskyi]